MRAETKRSYLILTTSKKDVKLFDKRIFTRNMHIDDYIEKMIEQFGYNPTEIVPHSELQERTENFEDFLDRYYVYIIDNFGVIEPQRMR